MDDDIDDLLNEVETKFCSADRKKSAEKQKKTVDNLKPSTTSSSISNSKNGQGLRKPNSKDTDLNAMIDDIFDDSVPLDPLPDKRKHSLPSVHKSSLTATKSSGTAKCFPIFMGGMDYPKGLCTAANKRVCDMLRCTDCDFRVEIFDHCCWHPKTDYLFLRNNMPDYEKLKPNLVHRKGWRAYGCQCKSKSVEDTMDIQSTGLKWVCGKH